MMTFIAIIHIVVALILIGLVLVQDSKGGGLGIGGGGSNSLLGATGATTLAAKATRFVAIAFALTCIALSIMTSKKEKSVLDSIPAAAATSPSTPESTPTATPATNETPATTAPTETK